LTVLNKVDLLTSEAGEPVASLEEVLEIEDGAEDRLDVVLISAAKRWGLEDLRTSISEVLAGELQTSPVGETLVVPRESPLEQQTAQKRRAAV